MAFCEDCGSPLTPGVLFCENCGAKVSNAEAASFSLGKETVEQGIIYTNLKLLAEKSEKTEEEIKALVSQFITDAENRGVGYTLTNVADRFSDSGSVKDHVEVIKSIVENSHPKYLFILGSYDVIPSITWKNEASDKTSDSDVTSDLPYSTLDTASAFDDGEYEFDECLRVGRLPTVDLENYFTNLKAVCGKVENIKTFGLSAVVWQEETRDIYKEIAAGPEVLTSPIVAKDNVKEKIPEDTNLLLFNLHGSRQTPFWYGQQDKVYPEAIAPDSFASLKDPYFLAVEACYGAYYEGKTHENSVLLNAMSGKCVTFLGSSRIAFGTPDPKGCCADIICGDFLDNLRKGMSAGDALNTARAVLIDDSLDPESIKTLAEFSLYGDPSARMKGMPVSDKRLFKKYSNKSFSKGIHIQLPDIRRMIRLELITVDKKISDDVEKFVYEKHSDLINIQPKFYRNTKTNDINAVFETKCEVGTKIVNVRLSKSGKVQQMLESK